MGTLLPTPSLFLCVLVAGCSTGRPAAIPLPRVQRAPLFNPLSYPTVGIFLENLSGERLDQGVLRAVEDEFMQHVMQKGYVLAARSDLEKVRLELRLQSSGVTEAAVARMGKALGVPAMILVSINSIGTSRRNPPALYNPRMKYYRTTAAVSSRMIGTERAEVLWIATFADSWNTESSGSRPREDWGPALQYVARIVASGLPARVR